MGKETVEGDERDPFRVAFGLRLAAARDAKGLTAEALGRQIAASKTNISHWENGVHTPKLPALAAICDVLDCSADYLLGRELRNYSADALEEARVFDKLSPEDRRKWRVMRRAMFATA